MTHWIETHRGAVPPWQCDVTEHFTIAYYFDRLEEAEANLGDALGVPHRSDIPRRIIGRFARELREGASFHVESAPIGLEAGLRLGHRFVDSANGEVVTWIEEHRDLSAAPLTSEQHHAIAARCATWNGPETEHRPDPLTTDRFIPTARGRVKHTDIDAAGNFALGAMVHRFSNSSAQLGAAIGMDAIFMQQNRRGFSTFELILRVSAALVLDAPYLVTTGIGYLGNSSLRMIHRMADPRSGTEIAQLSQYGVILDLDARRPARWPDDIRSRAEKLVVPVG
ncbi:MAG TPA: thioesterase family protein [Acetobacteraceae bacterium]|jgi:acyl-CoA thioesterase FadM|nr:thioesterase family protein [Acetobacteraceae bacterium]